MILYLLYTMAVWLGVVALILICAQAAKADTMFVKNGGGGWMVLFEHKCTIKELDAEGRKEVYSFTRDEEFFGCWALVDGLVTVYWMDGDTTVAPFSQFRTLQPWMIPYQEYLEVHAPAR